MIVFFIGTKAQFIKLVPIVKALNDRGINPVIANLGQHAGTISSLKKIFPFMDRNKVYDLGGATDTKNVREITIWISKILTKMFVRTDDPLRGLKAKLAVIHGDTLSTILSLWYAKNLGMKVAHIESGLRSGSFLHPFPEELIRVYSMRHSDYLFAPGDWAMENLRSMNVRGEIFNSGGNTVIDAVRMMLGGKLGQAKEQFCLATFHRMENIYSDKRIRMIVEALGYISSRIEVRLVLHGSTEFRLRKTGMLSSLEGLENLHILPLQNYQEFLWLMSRAEFVVTDGGSIQEESAVLGKPCLILRHRTERPDGIGGNAFLWDFDFGKLNHFLENYKSLKNQVDLYKDASPAMRICDVLKTIMGQL